MLSAFSQRLCLPSDPPPTSGGARRAGNPDTPGDVLLSADSHPMRRFSRRSLGGGLQSKCEQYAVVPNAEGQVVGQLLGAPRPLCSGFKLNPRWFPSRSGLN